MPNEEELAKKNTYTHLYKTVSAMQTIGTHHFMLVAFNVTTYFLSFTWKKSGVFFCLELSVPVIIFLSKRIVLRPNYRHRATPPIIYTKFNMIIIAQTNSISLHRLNIYAYIFICIWHNNSICLRPIHYYMVLGFFSECTGYGICAGYVICVCVCMHQCRAITFFWCLQYFFIELRPKRKD